MQFFLILTPSLPAPNNFRSAGSQREKDGINFSSGQMIQTRDSWVGSANASSVLCHPPIVECSYVPRYSLLLFVQKEFVFNQI